MSNKKKHNCRDTQATLAVLDTLDTDFNKEDDPDAREQDIMKKFGWEEEYFQGRITHWMKTKPKIWALFDEPYSSTTAKVIKFLISLPGLREFYIFFKQRLICINAIQSNSVQRRWKSMKIEYPKKFSKN